MCNMSYQRDDVAGGDGSGSKQSIHVHGDVLQFVMDAATKLQVDMVRMNVKAGRLEAVSHLFMLGMSIHQQRVRKVKERLEVVELSLQSSRRRKRISNVQVEELKLQKIEKKQKINLTQSLNTWPRAEISEEEMSVFENFVLQLKKRSLGIKPLVLSSSNSLPQVQKHLVHREKGHVQVNVSRTREPSEGPSSIERISSSLRNFYLAGRAGYFADPTQCLSVSQCALERRLESLGRELLRASRDGRTKDVQKLLNRGADVDFPNASKWTPLHMASRMTHSSVVSLLLEKGAKVNARNSYGYTAMHLAAYNDFSGRCAELLVKAGALVDSKSSFQQTPLHLAAECGNEKAVIQLLEAGANKCSRNEKGRTPFEVAKTYAVRQLLVT